MSVGTISGHVIDTDSKPVVGASVSIAGSVSLQPVSDIAALTTADGRFRFGNLLPGSYTISVHSTDYAPGCADVFVVADENAEVAIRIDHLSMGETFLEVKLVTDRIDWNQVRLVRVSLDYNDPEHGLSVTKNFLFSPVSRVSAVWNVRLKNKDRDQYTTKIVYFMKNGVHKTVGPEHGNDRTLILDQQR